MTEPTSPPVTQDWSPKPKCQSCGYELTGMRVEDRCPECGALVWSQSNQTPPTSGFAITSLVFGIVSICGCVLWGPLSLPLGVTGVVFGHLASRQYKQGLRAGGTNGLSIAGRVCSWIGVAMGGSIAAFFALAFFNRI